MRMSGVIGVAEVLDDLLDTCSQPGHVTDGRDDDVSVPALGHLEVGGCTRVCAVRTHGGRLFTRGWTPVTRQGTISAHISLLGASGKSVGHGVAG